MKHLTPADYRVMPWKNGRGSTTELYVHDRAGDSFGWRVSMAMVAEDGAFSRFPGYQRHIMAIGGDGFLLQGGPDGPIDVHPLFAPRTFMGDWDISAKLHGSPTPDFNLMADSRKFGSSLKVVRAPAGQFAMQKGAFEFVHALKGNAGPLIAGDSLLIEPGDDMPALAMSKDCLLALCEIWPFPA